MYKLVKVFLMVKVITKCISLLKFLMVKAITKCISL